MPALSAASGDVQRRLNRSLLCVEPAGASDAFPRGDGKSGECVADPTSPCLQLPVTPVSADSLFFLTPSSLREGGFRFPGNCPSMHFGHLRLGAVICVGGRVPDAWTGVLAASSGGCTAQSSDG